MTTNQMPGLWTLSFHEDSDWGPINVLESLVGTAVEVTYRSNGLEQTRWGIIKGSPTVGWLVLDTSLWNEGLERVHIGLNDITHILYL